MPQGHEPPCRYGGRVERDAPRDAALCISFVRSALEKSPDGQLERDIEEEIAKLQQPTHLPPETQELERQANQKIEEEKPLMDPQPLPETKMVPLIPQAWVKAAVGIGVALMGIAATMANLPLPIPDWVAPSIGALGALALYLAGRAADMPAVRALVPATMVPLLMTLSVAAGGIAGKLPPGKLQTVMIIISGVLGWLAGKVQPRPMMVVDGTAISRP